MVFRIATINDINDIRNIYASVIGDKYCVWNNEYPDEEGLNNDINTDNLYVLEVNNEIVGAISIVEENELDEYPAWSGHNAKEIARVAIKKKYHGYGYAKYLVGYALEIIHKRGYSYVHLSVTDINIPAQKTYSRLKFNKVGEADMYGHHYLLLEKKL